MDDDGEGAVDQGALRPLQLLHLWKRGVRGRGGGLRPIVPPNLPLPTRRPRLHLPPQPLPSLLRFPGGGGQRNHSAGLWRAGRAWRDLVQEGVEPDSDGGLPVGRDGEGGLLGLAGQVLAGAVHQHGAAAAGEAAGAHVDVPQAQVVQEAPHAGRGLRRRGQRAAGVRSGWVEGIFRFAESSAKYRGSSALMNYFAQDAPRTGSAAGGEESRHT